MTKGGDGENETIELNISHKTVLFRLFTQNVVFAKRKVLGTIRRSFFKKKIKSYFWCLMSIFVVVARSQFTWMVTGIGFIFHSFFFFEYKQINSNKDGARFSAKSKCKWCESMKKQINDESIGLSINIKYTCSKFEPEHNILDRICLVSHAPSPSA